MELGGAGEGVDRLLDEADGRLRIAGLLRDDAEKMQRIRLIGLQRQRPAIHRLRIGEPSGLMMCDSRRQKLEERGLRHHCFVFRPISTLPLLALEICCPPRRRLPTMIADCTPGSSRTW